MVLTEYEWGMVRQDDFKMDLSPFKLMRLNRAHIMMMHIIAS